MFLTVTGTPTNVQSELTGEYTVLLSWSAPASNTPSVAGYEVFYAVSGSDVTQSGGTTTTDTTAINVTLPNLSGRYDFFVVAFSEADNACPVHAVTSSPFTWVSTRITRFFPQCCSERDCSGAFENSCIMILNQLAFFC